MIINCGVVFVDLPVEGCPTCVVLIHGGIECIYSGLVGIIQASALRFDDLVFFRPSCLQSIDGVLQLSEGCFLLTKNNVVRVTNAERPSGAITHIISWNWCGCRCWYRRVRNRGRRLRSNVRLA